MPTLAFEPWEPEETVGKLWHGIVSKLAPIENYESAAVEFLEMAGRLSVLFRGLGGDPAVDILPTAYGLSHHRLSVIQKLGHEAVALPRASFDGATLRLPNRLALFPHRDANMAVYLWLTATAAHVTEFKHHDDALRADLQTLCSIYSITMITRKTGFGLSSLWSNLAEAALALRPNHTLPPCEAAVEAIIRYMLGGYRPNQGLALVYLEHLETETLHALTAPRSYRPFAPVPIWLELRPVGFSAPSDVATMEAEPTKESDKNGTFRAKRRKSDQANRKDSLILHRFESFLSWAEFINLNRRVDDDDNDDAKKAADDHEEISLGQISNAPATKLKLHLDLAPEDVDRERLSTKVTYPEWDTRTQSYLLDHCQVYDAEGELGPDVPTFRTDRKSIKRIEAVKRQFEALRPGRIFLNAQQDGDELDMEAVVRAAADLTASGETNDNIWRQSKPQARDLSVSILLDVSRSTESAVGDRSVIEIEREALVAFAWGLSACGDDFAINAFSSLKRDRVYITRCKSFDEPMSPQIEGKVGALHPGFYTRLGAAIRHVSIDLAKQARRRRLLLVITDGKPNDLDHYEGRHGIEDTRMAIHEARMMGHVVYGITVDALGQSWFARMFGANQFSIIANPDRLTRTLPQIYRSLVL